MNPDQSPYSANPWDEQPPVHPAPRKVIAPVSSEESIRAEISSTAPSAPQPNTEYATPQSSTTYDEPSSGYASSLITEPIQQTYLASSYAHTNVASQSQASDTVKSGRSTWKWLVTVMAIIGGGIYGYFALFSTQVFTHDLVEEKVQDTVYLRPRQWSAAGNTAGLAYGNMKGASGKSTAAVSVRVDTREYPGAVSMTDASLKSLRSQFLNLIDESSSAQFFQGDGVACKDEIKLTKKDDRFTTDASYGIYFLVASCTRTNDKVATEVRSRAVLGKDGYFRSISIIATEDIWRQNDDSFGKMLMSIDQVGSTTRG